ncbi:thioredoxin [Thiohalospira halophila DSM 15071]|uniref:Thioredoxin n=1 Tax=Thiohalospira halophila DSM 15071 TaxID=1123397 RepID=A0A1I1NIN7_9GAMM|nr:thioredoxin [Thiohalospira halophila]SFC97501.1 thioredoxin [Thiohalospira halophila DSM 15071]
MATVELTKDNFEQTIEDNDIVLVDFWASWCGPCKNFAPIYEEASENHSDIVFGKVNTEEEQELAASFQIRSIPTLMLFRQKVVLFSQAGALQGSQLEELIQKAREVDMEQVHKEVAEQQAQQADEQQ